MASTAKQHCHDNSQAQPSGGKAAALANAAWEFLTNTAPMKKANATGMVTGRVIF